MSENTPGADQLQALINYANTKTGANDATLSDAIARLASGYGGGSSLMSGSYTPDEDVLAPSFEIGSSAFSHFLICPASDPRPNASKKCFLFAYTSFGEKDEVALSSQNTGSSSIIGYFAYSWFSKNGSSVACTDNGASGAGHAGYWLAGVTYNWYAW